MSAGISTGFGRGGAPFFGINELVHIGAEKLGLAFETGTAVNIGHNDPDNCQRKRNAGQKTAELVRHHQKQIGPAEKLRDVNEHNGKPDDADPYHQPVQIVVKPRVFRFSVFDIAELIFFGHKIRQVGTFAVFRILV